LTRISDIPGKAAFNHFVLRQRTQQMHLRGVAHLAVGFVDVSLRNFPGVEVDRDIVLAGALCHDIGKSGECHLANPALWQARPDKTGYPHCATLSTARIPVWPVAQRCPMGSGCRCCSPLAKAGTVGQPG